MVVATIYVYAVAVGFVSAGIIGSGWALMTGDRPQFRLLLEPSVFVLFRTLAVVVHAPLIMLCNGFWKFLANPAFGSILIAASLGWSFLQGVFILSQFFGLK
jgi:ABC-type nitrate/sulfonate/bicarbonate transport system permease component